MHGSIANHEKKKGGGGKKTQVHKVSFKIILLLQV